MNKEDFKVLPGVGTNHPTEPSQPSASSNLTDAESAEQQVASKLVPQVSSNAGLGDSSFVWLYKYLGSPQPMKTHILSKHPLVYQRHNPAGKTNVTNPFDMAKEIALKMHKRLLHILKLKRSPFLHTVTPTTQVSKAYPKGQIIWPYTSTMVLILPHTQMLLNAL